MLEMFCGKERESECEGLRQGERNEERGGVRKTETMDIGELTACSRGTCDAGIETEKKSPENLPVGLRTT